MLLQGGEVLIPSPAGLGGQMQPLCAGRRWRCLLSDRCLPLGLFVPRLGLEVASDLRDGGVFARQESVQAIPRLAS